MSFIQKNLNVLEIFSILRITGLQSVRELARFQTRNEFQYTVRGFFKNIPFGFVIMDTCIQFASAVEGKRRFSLCRTAALCACWILVLLSSIIWFACVVSGLLSFPHFAAKFFEKNQPWVVAGLFPWQSSLVAMWRSPFSATTLSSKLNE